MRAERAFTLIELLVTIAVLGIVAALLLPALGRTKEKAAGAFCLNNLKQWGVATHLYVTEHSDYVPNEGKPTPLESDLANPDYQAWYIQLPEQISLPRYAGMPWRTNPLAEVGRSTWICPSNRRRCDASSRTNNLFHYCLNEDHNGTGPQNVENIKLTQLRMPVNLVWLFDSKNLPAVGPGNFAHTNLHGNGAQFVFLDGHAGRLASAEYWDFTLNRLRTNNPSILWCGLAR